MAKKKPNKERRAKIKAAHADIYEKGFKHGYSMALETKKQDKPQEVAALDMQQRYDWF